MDWQMFLNTIIGVVSLFLLFMSIFIFFTSFLSVFFGIDNKNWRRVLLNTFFMMLTIVTGSFFWTVLMSPHFLG